MLSLRKSSRMWRRERVPARSIPAVPDWQGHSPPVKHQAGLGQDSGWELWTRSSLNWVEYLQPQKLRNWPGLRTDSGGVCIQLEL